MLSSILAFSPEMFLCLFFATVAAAVAAQCAGAKFMSHVVALAAIPFVSQSQTFYFLSHELLKISSLIRICFCFPMTWPCWPLVLPLEVDLFPFGIGDTM